MSVTETPSVTPLSRPSGDEAGRRSPEARSWTSRESSRSLPRSAMTLPLPGGEHATLFADRVRAAPAVTPTLSMMLGQGAAGLGIWGLCFPQGVNRFLGMDADPNAVRLLFGARELATAGLAADPTRADLLWARVAGDVFDAAVLHRLDRPENPRRDAARLALGVVVGVAVLDLIAAVRMTTVKRNCI